MQYPMVSLLSVVTEGILFWGNSLIAGPQGEILAHASANKEEVLTATTPIHGYNCLECCFNRSAV